MKNSLDCYHDEKNAFLKQKNNQMKSNVLYKITFVLLCSSILLVLSCRRSAQKRTTQCQQIEPHEKRDCAGLRLGTMLNDRDFERALSYVDSLHKEYPDDPQFYFAEGWVYDMQGDSLRARAAYTKYIGIYDSLIVVRSDFNDMINRALVMQMLYGMDAYNRALDEMLSIINSSKDSLAIEQVWRKTVLIKDELSF